MFTHKATIAYTLSAEKEREIKCGIKQIRYDENFRVKNLFRPLNYDLKE